MYKRQVSSRVLVKLVLDEDFWLSLLEKAVNGSLDMENCCVDISDSTLSNVQCLESLYPCVLHQSEYSFGGKISLKQDTPEVVRLRGLVFTKKSVYETVSSGGNLQMVVGKLTADGQYAVLVSTSLAQITTAADVLRSVLPPVALLLFGLNVLAAILFSRCLLYTSWLKAAKLSSHCLGIFTLSTAAVARSTSKP